jgi:hypothetical protein
MFWFIHKTKCNFCIGDITVTSKKMEGTTFTIRIKCGQATAESSVIAKNAQQLYNENQQRINNAHRHILVVEGIFLIFYLSYIYLSVYNFLRR